MNIYEITLHNQKKNMYSTIYTVSKELSHVIQYLDNQGLTKNQSITAINKLNQTTEVHLI